MNKYAKYLAKQDTVYAVPVAGEPDCVIVGGGFIMYAVSRRDAEQALSGIPALQRLLITAPDEPVIIRRPSRRDAWETPQPGPRASAANLLAESITAPPATVMPLLLEDFSKNDLLRPVKLQSGEYALFDETLIRLAGGAANLSAARCAEPLKPLYARSSYGGVVVLPLKAGEDTLALLQLLA